MDVFAKRSEQTLSPLREQNANKYFHDLCVSYLVMSSGVETSLNLSEIIRDSSTSVGMTLNCRHGSSNNRDNQERSLHRDRRSGVDRRTRKQISSRKADGPLSLWRIDRKTVLRRHTFQDRLSSCRESGAGHLCHPKRSRFRSSAAFI